MRHVWNFQSKIVCINHYAPCCNVKELSFCTPLSNVANHFCLKLLLVFCLLCTVFLQLLDFISGGQCWPWVSSVLCTQHWWASLPFLSLFVLRVRFMLPTLLGIFNCVASVTPKCKHSGLDYLGIDIVVLKIIISTVEQVLYLCVSGRNWGLSVNYSIRFSYKSTSH